MFALPGILTLIAFVYLRPHEVSPFLRGIPCIPILYGASLLGLVLDLRVRLSRPRLAPHTGLALGFAGWSLLAAILAGSVKITGTAHQLAVPVLLFLLVAHGNQSFRSLETVATAVVALVLALAIMGLMLAAAPRQCIRVEPGAVAVEAAGIPEGRPCATALDCGEDGEPGFEYVCEKAGPAGTRTAGEGRVRYRGILQDPNEYAMTIALGLPLALALWSRRRSALRGVLLAGTFGLGLAAIIATASRSGQLVLLAVLGAYFVLRLRGKGLLVVGVLAAPALILGGRRGLEATASTFERMEAWAVGMRLWRESPLWGVGLGRFVDHHYLTAHNSFVLGAAELGTPALVLWIAMFYLGFKIAWTGMRRYRDREDAQVAYAWARGLLAALCGMLVGTSFLSLTYHPVIWLYFGMVGAYALAVRRHDPEWAPRLGRRDVGAVLAIAALFIAGLHVYVKGKGF
jgi:hypothetical protein